MKVLLICTEKLPVPPIHGGAIQTYIHEVVSRLRQTYDITILGVTDISLPNDEHVNNVRYIRVPSEGYFEFYANEVENFVQENKYDIIHIFNRPRLIAPVRRAAPDSRIILSMHNDMFGPNKIDPEEGLRAIEEAEKIITVSDYVGRVIINLFPDASSKLRTIYSGVDLNRFIPWQQSKEAAHVRQSLREAYELVSKKVILFVGRLSRKKGIDVLVRAMPELFKKHSDAVLVVVGASWYSRDKTNDYVAYVRALANRSPLPIVLTGYVPADQIHKWFWAGDLFVCTSIWEEPLARVHYESMAAGLPFITTDRGGNPEVVRENNGFIVENPNDPNEFAEKIGTILGDRNLRLKMGQNGRRLAEDYYDWNRVAQEIRDVWETTDLRLINEEPI